MTNPTPRPALRKAEDSDVHPAAPAPARRPRSTGSAPVSASGSAAAQPTPAKSPARRSAPAATAPATSAPTKRGPSNAPGAAAPAESEPVEPASAGPTAAEASLAAAPTVAPKRSKRYQTPPAVPVKNKRKRTGFTGTTSDHLRRSDAPAAAAAVDAEKAAKKRRKADAALMTGTLATTKVKLPKKLRKAAEKEAADRGLDLDAVLAELLHTWLTTRP